ncbi:MAG: hypothetical protein COV45_01540 [Deltaproteobacteria bacterium CG11_big_fil_rev_8_21_14_0_20_47_16]|nr:MAG: hypothetical protein COV45_01540 [Deltaproteobacteria bacterium CG11_big_fil_rev_8_21_14_0_20_47_16]
MSELPYTFPIHWYGDAMDAYAPFASQPGAFMVQIDKRYTLIGWNPLKKFSSTGAFVSIDDHTRIDTPSDALQKFMAPLKELPKDPYFPFYSGLVGYMLPEFSAASNDKSPNHGDKPDAWFGVYDPVLVFDTIEGRLTIISMGLDKELRPNAALAEERATELAQKMVRYNAARNKSAEENHHESPIQFMPIEDIQNQLCPQ